MPAVVVEIADELLPHLADWHRCEALRLVPHTDGSYSVEVTRDLAAAVLAELEAAA